jgi:hypothetical protein
MKRVDLALAVNYVPACVCLCKALVLMLALALIPAGEEVRGGYIPLAAMLYLDRLVVRNMIFDANAILLALYFANVHAAVRVMSHRQAYSVLVWGLHLCWIGMCLTLLAEPGRVRWMFEKRVQASKLVPVSLMLVILVGTAYVHAPLESGAIRACRGLAFTLLAFAWIYLVGIHTPHGIEYLKETSCQFVARLAPVLYSPLWLAALFPFAALGALLWHYTQWGPSGQQEVPPSAVTVVVESAPASQQQETPEEQQLKELFRQAKMMGSGRSSAGLNTIPE